MLEGLLTVALRRSAPLLVCEQFSREAVRTEAVSGPNIVVLPIVLTTTVSVLT